jgi:hypothetical protein
MKKLVKEEKISVSDITLDSIRKKYLEGEEA